MQIAHTTDLLLLALISSGGGGAWVLVHMKDFCFSVDVSDEALQRGVSIGELLERGPAAATPRQPSAIDVSSRNASSPALRAARAAASDAVNCTDKIREVLRGWRRAWRLTCGAVPPPPVYSLYKTSAWPISRLIHTTITNKP